MNSNRKALRALLACALVALALPAAADASDDWVAYRTANKLPVNPAPSAPGEGVLAPATPPWLGEASNGWVYHRRSLGFPVDAPRSAPGEGVLAATTPPWLGEAANFWVHYRRAQNLPVEYVAAKK
jgi:hypothetical protein